MVTPTAMLPDALQGILSRCLSFGQSLYFLAAAAGLVGSLLLLVLASMRDLRRSMKSLGHLPGPKASWPIGTAYLFYKRPEGGQAASEARGLDEVYGTLRSEYGKIFSFFLPYPVMVISGHVKAVHDVTVKEFRNFQDRPEPILVANAARRASFKSGITTASGAAWRGLRTAAHVVLMKRDPLLQYSQMMNNVAMLMVDMITADHMDGQPFDVTNVLQAAGLKIIFKCVFGVEVPPKDSVAQQRILEAGKKLFGAESLSDPLMQLINLFPSSLTRVAEHVMSLLFRERTYKERSIMYSLVVQLARNYCAAHPEVEPWPEMEHLTGPVEKLLPDDAMPSEDSVLVSLMCHKDATKRIPPSELLQQGVTFLLAGYETTATALSFAFYYISTRADVETKLLEEIQANGAITSTGTTYESLEKRWPYARGIVLETMRLRPITPALARVASKSCTVADIHVPKGTTVHIDINSVHMDPELWESPEAFRPERFVEDPDAHRSAKYLAFGCGPRNCIGYRFAMEEAVILLVRAYEKFSFQLSKAQHPLGENGQPELRVQKGMLLQTENGIWMTAHPR